MKYTSHRGTIVKRSCPRVLCWSLTGLALLLGYGGWKGPILLSEARVQKNFIVFDGTLYKQKPDMAQYGISPIRIIYSAEFWDQGQNMDRLPDETRVRRLAAEARVAGSIAIIDIENWPQHSAPVPVILEGLSKYTTVVQWFHKAAPDLQVGYYGVLPIIDYWRAVNDPMSTAHVSWVHDNERLRPLRREVDALFPSLYTFYDDQSGWSRYAVAQMTEARRLAGEKPVYVFLWPQYHESNQLLGGRYLSPDFWRLELETAKSHADGVVLWGGWGQTGPADWDESAPWWKVTKDFVRSLDSSSPGRPDGPQIH